MKHKLMLVLITCASLMSVAVTANGEGGGVAEVSIKKFKFIPEEITVKVGTKVRWTNNEKRQYHSVWFKDAGGKPSEYFFPDETYEHTFDKAGTFPYTCEPHPEMLGVVKVVQ